MPHFFEAINALVKTYPIDTKRIYVTGQSMGEQGACVSDGPSPVLPPTKMPDTFRFRK